MKDFEQDKEYQAMHEAYQAESNEMPPEALDERILKAAHQAVAGEHASAGLEPDIYEPGVDTQPVKRAWYVPVSYVAILVISLSVVMKLAIEPEMSPVVSSETGIIGSGTIEADVPESAAFKPEQFETEKAQSPEDSVSSFSIKQEMATAPVARKAAPLTKKRVPVADTAMAEKAGQAELSSDNIEAAQLMPQQSRQLQGVADSGQLDVLLPSPTKVDMKAKRSTINAAESREKKTETAKESLESDLKADEGKGEITPQQKSLIETLVKLYKNREFEALEVALIDYRKKYPLDDNNKYLPQELLDWEAEHITKLPEKNKEDTKKNK